MLEARDARALRRVFGRGTMGRPAFARRADVGRRYVDERTQAAHRAAELDELLGAVHVDLECPLERFVEPARGNRRVSGLERRVLGACSKVEGRALDSCGTVKYNSNGVADERLTLR